MSHHLVTVCMFCMLCAAHTCGSHIDMRNDGMLTYDPKIESTDHISMGMEDKRKIDTRMMDLEEKRRMESRERYNHKLQKIRHKDRSKREAKNINTEEYVARIFHIYGDTKSMTMNLTGLNKMLKELDLDNLINGGEMTDSRNYFHGQKNEGDVVKVC